MVLLVVLLVLKPVRPVCRIFPGLFDECDGGIVHQVISESLHAEGVNFGIVFMHDAVDVTLAPRAGE